MSGESDASATTGDLLETARSLTASDVRTLVTQLTATLASGERGGACTQQLAALYRVSRLQSRSIRSMLAAAEHESAADTLVYHLASVVIERKLSRAVRQLAAVLLHELARDEPRTLRPSFRGYDAHTVVPLLLPLLAWCGSAASVAANADSLANCLATADGPTRSAAILALVRLCERRRLSWFPAQPPVELALAAAALDAQLVAFLSDRSALVAAPSAAAASGSTPGAAAAAALPKPSPSKRQAVAAFVGKLSSAMATASAPAAAAVLVTEPDGAPQRDFFTVLNVPQRYSHMQICDVVAFSSLLRWLRVASPSPELRAAAFAHCARIVDQTGGADSSAPPPSDAVVPGARRLSSRNMGSSAAATTAAAAAAAMALDASGAESHALGADEGAALAEVARVLVELARLGDASEAQRSLALVRRAYEHLPTAQAFVHTSLLGAALRIATRHRLSLDAEPLLRAYFTSFLPRHTCSSHTALETFELCRAHRRALASGAAGGGNLFAAYFPALFKLFCWTPAHFADVQALLPLMATSRTFVELFHLLVDLPLVAAALERVHAEGSAAHSGGGGDASAAAAANLSNSGGGGGGSGAAASLGGSSGLGDDEVEQHTIRDDAVNIDGLSSSKRGAERVLYNLLLRSEAGCSFNLWENGSTTLPLLLAFSAQTPQTHLLTVVCERAPLLLQRLLDLLLLEPDRSTHAQLLVALVARVERVPTLGAYGARVRDLLQQFVARLLAKRPALLVTQRETVLDVLRDAAPAQLELACVLVFCVGRHLTLQTCEQSGAQLGEQIERYFAQLEVLAYELSGDSLEQPVQLRLLLLTLSCMAKLACRQPPLVPRVLLCLVSKIRNAAANELLLARAQELIRLLRNPVTARELFEHGADDRVLWHHVEAV